MNSKKIVEVKQKGYDKEGVSKKMIQMKKILFILAIGDDTNDEGMLSKLPSYAYSF